MAFGYADARPQPDNEPPTPLNSEKLSKDAQKEVKTLENKYLPKLVEYEQRQCFFTQNLYYNAEEDYFVCPIGQQMNNVGTGTRKSENGFESEVTYYETKKCPTTDSPFTKSYCYHHFYLKIKLSIER
ncbi:hypothetical protein FACS1894201_04130 [Bacteroidia bacterium]|nr:hypothetical protein FACS1894201_04130 [Bacteroidia bacterium]